MAEMGRCKVRLIGLLGSCPVPECGGVDGYFCVKCRHYVVDCRCTPGLCECGNYAYWASTGERPELRALLVREAAQ